MFPLFVSLVLFLAVLEIGGAWAADHRLRAGLLVPCAILSLFAGEQVHPAWREAVELPIWEGWGVLALLGTVVVQIRGVQDDSRRLLGGALGILAAGALYWSLSALVGGMAFRSELAGPPVWRGWFLLLALVRFGVTVALVWLPWRGLRS